MDTNMASGGSIGHTQINMASSSNTDYGHQQPSATAQATNTIMAIGGSTPMGICMVPGTKASFFYGTLGIGAKDKFCTDL